MTHTYHELPTAYGVAQLRVYTPTTVAVTTVRNKAPEWAGELDGTPFDAIITLRLIDGTWQISTLPEHGADRREVSERHTGPRRLTRAQTQAVRTEMTRAVQAWEDDGRSTPAWDFARAGDVFGRTAFGRPFSAAEMARW